MNNSPQISSGYEVGDVDAGQAAAVFERPVVDSSDGIGDAAVSDGCRDGYMTRVIAYVRIIYISLVCHSCFSAIAVVINTVDFEVVSGGNGWQQEQGEFVKMFHYRMVLWLTP